jgi:imidazolonepropionase-like amidohydrolase
MRLPPLLAGLTLYVLSLSSHSQVVAIHAGTVLDPGSGTALRDQTIVIERGLIKSISPYAAQPAAAQVIDLSHEFVLPGLMDAHSHLTVSYPKNNIPLEEVYLEESNALRAMRGLMNARVLLGAGFTAIRDVGNSGEYAMVDVRRAVERGWFPGPTIITTGKMIAPFGGQSHNTPPDIGRFWKYEYIDADSQDQLRSAVRQNVFYGAQLIKLILDNSPYHYSVDDLRVVIAEAHKAGVPVAVHVYSGEAADNAIEAGVDSIEHGFALTDAQLTRMKAKGIFLVSTDFPRAHLDLIGGAGGELSSDSRELSQTIVDRLRRAWRIGVRIPFGSDAVIDVAGRSRADMIFDYLAVWREAGIPPEGILRSMTSEAAAVMKLDKTRGRMAPGFAADVIAVPGDPRADIELLRKVDFVMKDGKIVRTPGQTDYANGSSGRAPAGAK